MYKKENKIRSKYPRYVFVKKSVKKSEKGKFRHFLFMQILESQEKTTGTK